MSARCTYDNPMTQMREAWENGWMVASCPRELLEFGLPHKVHGFLPTLPRAWKDCQHQGDIGARSLRAADLDALREKIHGEHRAGLEG